MILVLRMRNLKLLHRKHLYILSTMFHINLIHHDLEAQFQSRTFPASLGIMHSFFYDNEGCH